ncbi:MAG: hypothetical protein ABI184_04015 [Ginsengibacter sp.]
MISCIHFNLSTIDWSTIYDLLTFALLFFAVRSFRNLRRQIRLTQRTTNADFAERFKKALFTNESRELFFLVDNDLLTYETINIETGFDIHLFKQDKTKVDLIKSKIQNFDKITSAKETYTSYELDDYLLQHFEDLGYYEEIGILSIEDIYNGFAYYIETCYENTSIKTYVDNCRKGNARNKDMYDKFITLYDKIQEYNKTH